MPHPMVYKVFVALFILLAATQWLSEDAAARRKGDLSFGAPGPVAVRGHFRSNGTYVAPYQRSAAGRARFGSGGYSYGGGGRGWGPGVHFRRVEGTYRSGYQRAERSQGARIQFLRRHGYLRLPAGYEIDHILPLSQGGSDTPDNMQLLSVEEHHRKTARERRRY